MIKNIIFDMGNVLLKYDTDLPLGAFCPDEEARNFIRRELFESAEWIEADRRIYEYILDKYGLKAEECLFIDDLERNVRGAEEVGINAVRFENNYGEIAKKYGL